MCCDNSKGGLSRLGLFLGISTFIILLVAFINNSWLTTREPIPLPNSRISTIVQFRIGFWEACPFVRRINSTIHVPRPSCSLIKYEGWTDVTYSDLGLWAPLELAPVFITRMRSCTVLTGSAVILLSLASLFALLGQCNGDNKTLIACGFFILSGLSLGTGLVIFATALSETLSEIQEYSDEPDDVPSQYDYRYGWCFMTAGTAFILTNLAAMFSLSGYLKRFTSIDEMVRQMVPGADRKLKEHQFYSSGYLLKHSNVHQPIRPQYEIEGCNRNTKDAEKFHPKYESEYCGPLLNKTPPDVCTTNKCVEFDISNLNSTSCSLASGVVEYNYNSSNTLAGQTVPITIKNHNVPSVPPPVTYANLPPAAIKFGTLPSHHGITSSPTLIGVGDLGSTSSNSSYCTKSKTLQPQKQVRKKCVKIETFQTTPETAGFSDFGTNKKSVSLQYSGSAV